MKKNKKRNENNAEPIFSVDDMIFEDILQTTSFEIIKNNLINADQKGVQYYSKELKVKMIVHINDTFDKVSIRVRFENPKYKSLKFKKIVISADDVFYETPDLKTAFDFLTGTAYGSGIENFKDVPKRLMLSYLGGSNAAFRKKLHEEIFEMEKYWMLYLLKYLNTNLNDNLLYGLAYLKYGYDIKEFEEKAASLQEELLKENYEKMSKYPEFKPILDMATLIEKQQLKTF